MPSYTGRITTKGAPIIVSRTGKTFSIPQKGVFSTRLITTYSNNRISLVKTLGSGKVAVLQTRISKVALGAQVVTTKVASATQLRNTAGIGKNSGNLTVIQGRWLRGTGENLGLFPKQVADKLSGKQFKNFDDFRRSFWKTVANTPELASQFTEKNLKGMRRGLAPIAPETQHLGKQDTYILHHKTPINKGGGVYDMDNLVIVTPRYHKEILEKGYHYGSD